MPLMSVADADVHWGRLMCGVVGSEASLLEAQMSQSSVVPQCTHGAEYTPKCLQIVCAARVGQKGHGA